MNQSKKNFWQQYGLYIVVCSAALILILAVVLFISQNRKKGRVIPTEEAVSGGIIVNNSTSEYENFTYDFSVIGLKKDAYPEINELARLYLEALREGDVESLNKIIQSDTKLSEGSVSATGGYVESYDNISCYTMDGLEDGTYVVYVVYDEKLIGIDTPAPSMIRLYVCTDTTGDGVYIYNGTLTGEMKTYMEIADSDEDVSILKSQVNQAFLAACQSDPALAEVYKRLQQTAATSVAKDTAAGSEASETASETKTQAQTEETSAKETVSE